MTKNKLLKSVSVFAIALLIVFTNLGDGFKAYAAVCSDATIEVVVDEYMKAREKLFKSNHVKKLEEMAVIGIIKDENIHRELFEELGFKVKKIECEIESIVESDIFVEVIALEKLIYTKNEEKTQCETEHVITLMKDKNENWNVVSDAYYEGVTEFISCSYVPEGDVVSTFALSDTEIPKIVSVAGTQVGYLEKETNSNLENFTANAGDEDYTKYGAWYGWNGVPWCAIFVSWCANQAGYDTTMVPKYASCDIGKNTFDGWDRFYDSSAYGGSYIPKPGDIYFKGIPDDATHTGIVASVDGTTMTVIDGNCNASVRRHTLQITDSSLLGFATSCTHNADRVQKYNVSYHWNACSVCGISVSLKVAHTFNSVGKCSFCPATQASTAALKVSLLME